MGYSRHASKSCPQIKLIDPKLPQRSIRNALGLNDLSAVGVDYLQSSPVRIDELPIPMVQTHAIQKNHSLVTTENRSHNQITDTEAIIKSSFATAIQVWGKIGAVI